jgi:hypothetical protein
LIFSPFESIFLIIDKINAATISAINILDIEENESVMFIIRTYRGVAGHKKNVYGAKQILTPLYLVATGGLEPPTPAL